MDLNKAIDIANHAHAGQFDKGGKPYILHPLRVMMAMDGDDERIVAVLHDVVEDSCWLLEALIEQGLRPDLAEAVDALTHRDGEPYMASYIERVAANPLARKVKLADLADNLSPSRALPGSEAASWGRRHRAAQERLEAA